ncbi:polyketide synthase [Pseudomonas sp. WS 5411]|uniref:polyketide synthase n=1 Tax=Pseudomonas sp. WS 5411 TaxID=2717486 RepID=UPI001475E9EF|nr:polyketide synthase [Pseudomonas sp. WS 5411]NMY85650.1 polyketide synthase [Pseudomonas sp. WS 5411]
MRLELGDVVQEFIVSNGKMVQSYFSLSERIIDSLGDSDTAKESILMRLLAQAETVTVQYLNAHKQVLEGAFSRRVEVPINPTLAQLETSYLNSATLATATLDEPGSAQLPAVDVEASVLEQLAIITGFTVDQIDQEQPYESLGLDSLVQMEFLESLVDLWPELKASGTQLLNAKCPQHTIALIKAALAAPESPPTPASAAQTPEAQSAEPAFSQQLFDALVPLIPGEPKAFDIDTPFTELGLNGFAREAFCQVLAQQCSASQFAGEALMSCRTPRDTLWFLERLS